MVPLISVAFAVTFVAAVLAVIGIPFIN